MGRGRAKAKQTKIARKMKYGSAGTDLDRLRRELGVSAPVADAGGDAGNTDPEQAGEAGEDTLGDGAGDLGT